MPRFIQTDRVPVADGAGNTVWVRRKMDMGTRLRTAEASNKGEMMVAYYVHNIMAWDGPDFKGIKCTPENIEKIDLDDPFWVEVGDKIAELNPPSKETDPDPLSSTMDGDPSSQENEPPPEVDTTSK